MKRFTFLPLMFIVWFTMSVINTASAGPALEFFSVYVVFCLIVIGVIVGLIALFRSIRSSESTKQSEMMNPFGAVETDFQVSATDARNEKPEILYKNSNTTTSVITFSLIMPFILIIFIISFIVLFVKLLENRLILFSVIIFIIIFLFYIMLKRDDDSTNSDSTNYPMPSLTALNPFEIAALRDGRKGIIQTALFNLCYLKKRFMLKAIKEPYDPKFHCDTEKELFRNFANVTRCCINHSPTQQPEGAIEDAIDQFAQDNKRLKAKDFFTDLGLRTTLDQLMEPINQKLRQMHLKTENGKTRLIHPYASNNTKLGDRYLNRLTEHFQWAKHKKSSVEPSLLVAIYGIQNLEDSKDFSGFSLAFSNMTASGTEEGGCGGCGGCGGGCGGG